MFPIMVEVMEAWQLLTYPLKEQLMFLLVVKWTEIKQKSCVLK